RAAPQRPAPPPHFLRAQRVATPPLSQPAAALGGGESSRAGYSHGGGDALPPAPAVAGGHGHRPHLRAASGGSRPTPPALYRRGAACRRRVAAGQALPRAAVSPPLAALPLDLPAPPAQRGPESPVVDRKPLPEVSHRLHRQRDEPVRQWTEGGRVLLSLHGPAAPVGTSDHRLRRKAGDAGLSR